MAEKSISNKDLLLPDNMLRMYAFGAFPMADEKTGSIQWYCPEVRTIIPLESYNIPRSLNKFLEHSTFEFRRDTDFISVVKACADRDSTWISEELIAAYLRLYKGKHIHTIEVWDGNELVGGLYGISFRGAFFGESMFSKVSQASKAALAYLLQYLKEKDFVLLDVQYMTPHLKMFGAVEIPFQEYQNLLNSAYIRNCEF
jgi:leucyl/phenylalanyl-tRNA---protein transferase